ncbi:hypothetical protein [Nitrobacter sp.]|uniref:hypothetical protein n=1 Tax=Nitrobacter sp. TaxID=29420 RepID=UPI003F64D269
MPEQLLSEPLSRAAATSQSRQALRLAIEQSFFMGGSAAAIARNFSSFGHVLHASDVQRIWASAREAGRLPKLRRPHGGPKARARS